MENAARADRVYADGRVSRGGKREMAGWRGGVRAAQAKRMKFVETTLPHALRGQHDLSYSYVARKKIIYISIRPGATVDTKINCFHKLLFGRM